MKRKHNPDGHFAYQVGQRLEYAPTVIGKALASGVVTAVSKRSGGRNWYKLGENGRYFSETVLRPEIIKKSQTGTPKA